MLNIFFKQVWNSSFCKKLWAHLLDFSYIWILIVTLLFIAWFVASYNWGLATKLIGLILALIAALILFKPMNTVYGMMGTGGSVHVFFVAFLIISFLFAGIYQFAFFKDAGITYDVNQTHIDYNLYAKEKKEVKNVVQSDTLVYKRQIDKEWKKEIVVQEYELNYQPIGFFLTWRNTILTALMQQPTDLFLAASTYNESMVNSQLSKEEQ